MKLADYVINESGFGADLGAEKYFDLVMPQSGLKPSTAVLIATARALAAHGTSPDFPNDNSLNNLRRGLANLEKHLQNLRKYKVPVVVAINRFTTDTDEEVAAIQEFCREANVESAIVDVYSKGGEGAMDLAAKVMALADASDADIVTSLYGAELGLEEKVERVAKEIYGAGSVYFDSEARKKLRNFTKLGFGQLPVCIAKTPASLSDNPKVLGAPRGWTMTATDAHLSAGAGFVVVVAGSMMLMPGLPKVPQAAKLDVDDRGEIIGMNY